MLNHAASVNAERVKARVNRKTEKDAELNAKDPVVLNGKRLSELNSDELAVYYSSF